MKIVHLITSLSRGGAEHMLFKLLSAQRSAAESAVVVSMTPSGVYKEKIEKLGVRVLSLGMKRGVPSIGAVQRLRRLLASEGADVLHCWMYHSNVLGTIARASYSARIPLVWGIRHSVQDMENERMGTRIAIWLNARMSSSPDSILFNSHTSATQHAALGFEDSRSSVIPNGFDCSLLRFSEAERRRIRHELRIGAGETVVMHIARFHPMKDHQTLLTCSRLLANSSRKFVFILVGAEVTADNPFFNGCEGASYRLLGEREDIPALLSAADIACLSSAYGEAFPNVLGEAMAIGVPCVATDVGDARQIIGDTGLIVPPGSATELAAAIDRLACEEQATRAERKLAARTRVERYFSLESVARQYGEVYEKLLSGN